MSDIPMLHLTHAWLGRLNLFSVAFVFALLPFQPSTSLWGQDKTKSSVERVSLYFPEKQGEWERIDPAQVGWDKAKLDAALSFAGGQKSSGVVVLFRGRILAEQYWTVKKSLRYRAMRHGQDANGHALEDVASVQKSVAATLLAVALDRELVKLDDPVESYLGQGWSNASRDVESGITLRHLITMTTGLTDRLEFSAPAGSKWKYNTNAYSRIVNVMEAASDLDRNQITRKWLGPIGMSDSNWVVRRHARQDPKTNRYGFVTSARDLARFGLMILAKGKWNGETVVPDSQYFRDMLQPSQKLNPSYGYLWWLNGQSHAIRAGRGRRQGSLLPAAPRDLVAGLGALGRKVYVVPSQELVVTRLGDAPGVNFDEQFWRKLMAASPK